MNEGNAEQAEEIKMGPAGPERSDGLALTR